MDKNVKIINDKKYLWHYEKVGDARIYFKGLFWHGHKYFQNLQACRKLSEIFCTGRGSPFSSATINIFREKILKLRGHFSFIIANEKFVLAFVDKIRSYPIFYCNKSDTLFISNSAKRIQTEAGLYESDKVSLLEFEMAGYVTGGKTLFENLSQLQAGEFLYYDKFQRKFEAVRYYRYWSDEPPESDDQDDIGVLHEVVMKTFKDMIETLGGRPVWIPLSGGLDSRLILALLHNLGYADITAFSYGMPGLWEAKEAKKVADFLKVRWRYIPYEPKRIKRMFHTTERERYFRFASGLTSLPFLADFYAIWLLREENAIPNDAIFINGQTGDYLTGGHVPRKTREIGSARVTVDVLIRAIVEKHFSLWTNLKNEGNLALISGRILDGVGLSPDAMLSAQEFAKYYELHEWQERQAKYVVNGQRMYEWFGYDWRLPHWSEDLMAFWAKVDWRKKYLQRLYKEYLKRYNIAGVFTPPSLPGVQYAPFGIKIMNRLFVLLAAATGMDDAELQQKYSRYFMSYAPFYPQRSYFEYLKDSRWHRSCVSYLAKEVLKGV